MIGSPREKRPALLRIPLVLAPHIRCLALATGFFIALEHATRRHQFEALPFFWAAPALDGVASVFTSLHSL